MAKIEWPDDDGEKTMVWIKDGRERERVGCEKVRQVFAERPWVRGEIIQTVTNGPEDCMGIDMFIPVRKELLDVLDIWSVEGLGLPIQVKSSRRSVRDFLKEKHMISRGKPVFRDGLYTITLNGTDAKCLILADLVGQMIVLSKWAKNVSDESDFLWLLSNYFCDREAVKIWREQKMVVLDDAWYNGLVI